VAIWPSKHWSDQNLSEFRGEPDWSDLTNLKRSDRFSINQKLHVAEMVPR
jgi:hypothetical protein